MKWKKKFKVGDRVYWFSKFDHKRNYEEVHHETFEDGEHKIFFVNEADKSIDDGYMLADRVELRQEFIEKPKRKIKVRIGTCVDFKPMEVELRATTYGFGVKWSEKRSKK